MSLFTQKPVARCGAIIDVGSGSVGVAVVVSQVETGKLDIIWSHREHLLLKDTGDNQTLLKEINTTIMNALLELGSSGVKALHEVNPQLSIRYVQTAVCAPWAYTITKNIQFEDDEPFEVDKDLLEELVNTAKDQTLATTLDGKIFSELGLEIIHDSIIDVQLNGYSVQNPLGTKTKSISLAHVSSLVSSKIIATLDESIEKILPKAQVSHYSFMFLFYQVLKYLHPDTTEICLVDVTNEATEIGIVRDNILQHTTFVPFGLFSLSREIALSCSIPKEEAYSLLKDGTNTMKNTYNKEKQTEIDAVFLAYENKVAEILADTGDALSIPKTLFIHTSVSTEECMSERLKNAATLATKKKHTTHLFTSELLGEKKMSDSALALSAHYFHTQEIYAKPLK